MMTQKQRLDDVWNRSGVAQPNHVARWFLYPSGNLDHTKGKLLGPKRQKIKGKGWTFLNKHYGLVWAFRKREYERK